MSWKGLSTAAAALWLGACVYHIDSAIPDELVTFNPAFVGTWVASDSARVIITASRDSIYHIRHTKPGDDTLTLRARLGRLGERTVAEFWPAGEDADESWPVGRMLVIIEVANDMMKTWVLDRDSIRSALERRDLPLPHLAIKGDITLTAPTPDLAPALTAYLRRPGVLADEQSWRRVRQ